MCWLLLVIWFEYKISRTISNPRLEITCFNPVELTPSEAREGGDAGRSECLMRMLQWGGLLWSYDDIISTCQPPATSGAAPDNIWHQHCRCLHLGSYGYGIFIELYYFHFMTGSQCRTNMTRPGDTHQSVASYNYLPIHPLRRRLKQHRYDHRAKYLGPVSN